MRGDYDRRYRWKFHRSPGCPDVDLRRRYRGRSALPGQLRCAVPARGSAVRGAGRRDGGRAAGWGAGRPSAVASGLAVDVFVTRMLAAGRPPDPGKLRAAVAEVQRRVRAAGTGLAGLTGCTLAALLPTSLGDAWITQIG